MIQQTFGFSLFLFLLATGLVVRQMWTTRSVGLGCAYLFQLWMFYAIGPCLHALPWSELPNNEPVFDGFAVSAYGAMAFAAGWCLRPMLFAIRRPRPVHHDQRIAKVYLMCGVFSFFVLQPLFGGLPSIASVVHAAGQLTLAGFCLGAFLGWHQRGWMQMLKWVVPSLLVPLVTVIRLGFLGYGIIALSVVAIFCATFARPRWVLVVGFVVAGYCGLSLYIAYMHTRSEIRAAVWGGEDLAARLEPILLTASRLKPFDFTDQNDLATFDGRMDQSYLAGLAIERLSESEDFAHGTTLKNAALAIIPRILWPDKPMSGGSGDLVSRFTGLHFAKGTSVGVGAVMEFYVNFGIPCVVIGFAVLGLVLSFADAQAAEHLRAGDWQRFVMWFLFGLSFLQVGGSFVEVISTAGASVVTAHLINAIVGARARSRAAARTELQRELQAV